MIHRFEIAMKPGIRDARGDNVRNSIREFLNIPVKQVVSRDIFKIKAKISAKEADLIRREFTDSVVQESSLGKHPTPKFDWLILVGFRPGVTDNVGRSSRKAIEDILGRKLADGSAVFTETAYLISGGIKTKAQAMRAGKDLLANELIETTRVFSHAQWEKSKVDLLIPEVTSAARPSVKTINLEVSDKKLETISREGTLALSLEEMQAIQAYYRDPKIIKRRKKLGLSAKPTDVELEALAQTWSEHCKHKIFNADIAYTDETGKKKNIRSVFKTFIQKATADIQKKKKGWLLSVFHDNAGMIKFNDKITLSFKVETHNSPSALDPYGGAMTGIVGVNRDPFGTGMGCELLINVWGYCLGSPFYEGKVPKGLLHPRRIRDGVHKGVIDGGNQSGIPYGWGWEYFDERYLGKPLVYCGSVGIIPKKVNGKASEKKEILPGDLIVMTGGRIGKDGIHGATFSSEELHSDSPVQAVQIGDPITQKIMTDFLLEARDKGLYRCITDNGAGGLSSSVGEMAEFSGGCELDLKKAPLKYAGMMPWEILISEAQERMTLAIQPEKIDEFIALAKKREVDASILGTFTDTGLFHIRYGKKTVACLDMEFLHEGVPRLQLEAEWSPPESAEPELLGEKRIEKGFKAMLGRLNIASLEKKSRQYDHEVKGLTVIKPFVGAKHDVPSDASVFLPEHGSREGIVLSYGINPSFSDVDTYHMMASVIDESVRKAVAVGADPTKIAGVENFCWPDPVQSKKTPDGRYKLAQLVRTNMALYDYTTAFGVPIVSGKDSMKNDSTRGGVKISIPPTLLFSAIGRMDDVRKAMTLDFKKPGDLIYVLGETHDELGGSEYFRLLSEEAGTNDIGVNVPKVDAAGAQKLYAAVAKGIKRGLFSAVHSPAKGGLAIGFAKMSFAGRLGMKADLRKVPCYAKLEDERVLFSETNSRFIVTIPKENKAKFATLFKEFACAQIGSVTSVERIIVKGRSGKAVIDADSTRMIRLWKEPLNGI